MKKLIRWHYKEYLFFLIATIMGCIAFFEQVFEYRILSGYYAFEKEQDHFFYYMDMELDMLFNNVFYFYFETLFFVLTGSILVQKAFHYWSLKDGYGRCYFASLPFKKTDHCITAFLRDLLTIVITLVVSTVYMYIRLTQYIGQEQIFIPWMTKSLIGMAVITGCYLIFLLGIYNILESLFVNGIVKLIGSLGILGALGMILEKLFSTFPKSRMVVDCYGFLTMTNTAGNCHLEEYYYRGDIYHTFIHQLDKVPYLYKGEEVWYTAEYVGSMDLFFGELSFEGVFCRFYDFRLLENYLPQGAIYMILGFLLAGTALWLTGRQEESKTTFYHVATKYILCVLLSLSVFVVSYENGMSLGRICMAIVSAGAILVLSVLLIERQKREYVGGSIEAADS